MQKNVKHPKKKKKKKIIIQQKKQSFLNFICKTMNLCLIATHAWRLSLCGNNYSYFNIDTGKLSDSVLVRFDFYQVTLFLVICHRCPSKSFFRLICHEHRRKHPSATKLKTVPAVV